MLPLIFAFSLWLCTHLLVDKDLHSTIDSLKTQKLVATLILHYNKIWVFRNHTSQMVDQVCTSAPSSARSWHSTTTTGTAHTAKRHSTWRHLLFPCLLQAWNRKNFLSMFTYPFCSLCPLSFLGFLAKITPLSLSPPSWGFTYILRFFSASSLSRFFLSCFSLWSLMRWI